MIFHPLVFVLLLVGPFLQEEALNLEDVVVNAFRNTHGGYSSDEVILNDKLNQSFIAACRKQIPDVSELTCNWKLINLRKAGKLTGIKTTARNRESTDKYRVIAEIVSRTVLDRSQVSIDRVMADPKWKKKFDLAVLDLDQDAKLYSVRKAAFKLRKTRQLRPELITRIADWDRQVLSISADDFAAESKLAPEQPGIYIFFDDSGYLYIGHSENIRKRLCSHLEESSNFEFLRYLGSNSDKSIKIEIHAFPKESRMKEVVIRRAYESELIRSRKPRFNILP